MGGVSLLVNRNAMAHDEGPRLAFRVSLADGAEPRGERVPKAMGADMPYACFLRICA